MPVARNSSSSSSSRLQSQSLQSRSGELAFAAITSLLPPTTVLGFIPSLGSPPSGLFDHATMRESVEQQFGLIRRGEVTIKDKNFDCIRHLARGGDAPGTIRPPSCAVAGNARISASILDQSTSKLMGDSQPGCLPGGGDGPQFQARSRRNLRVKKSRIDDGGVGVLSMI